MDSRVRTLMTTEGEVDDIRGIQDMGVGTKRKEDPASSNPGNKQKTFVSQGYPGRGRGQQDQGQDGTFSQANDVLSLSTAWTLSTGFPSEAGIPRFGDGAVPVS